MLHQLHNARHSRVAQVPSALAGEDTRITNEFHCLNFVIRVCTLAVVWVRPRFPFVEGGVVKKLITVKAERLRKKKRHLPKAETGRRAVNTERCF